MTSPFKDHAGVTRYLEQMADGIGSPAYMLQHAMMAAMSKNASTRAKATYQALRAYFRSEPIRAPDGALYHLISLQRDYVRYELVERCRAAGHKGLKAYHIASDYLADGPHAQWNTVRDTHRKIKSLLKMPGMKAFCQGLDYEFQIALYGDDEPPAGSIVQPDFMRTSDAGHS
jgi:hypothetical protein